MAGELDRQSLVQIMAHFFISYEWISKTGSENSLNNENLRPVLSDFTQKHDGNYPFNYATILSAAYMLFMLPKAIGLKNMDSAMISTDEFQIVVRGNCKKPVLNRVRNSLAHARISYNEGIFTLTDDNKGKDKFEATIGMVEFAVFIHNYFSKFIEILRNDE